MGYLKINTDLISLNSVTNKRFVNKLRITLKDRAFPVPLSTLKWTVFGIALLYLAGLNPLYSIINAVRTSTIDVLLGSGVLSTALVLGVTSVLIWLAFVQVVRCSVRLVLYYKGWINEPMGKPSLPTKLWLAFLGIVMKVGKPGFFSYQDLLPALPLPPLDETIKRYLKSVKPLLSQADYDDMELKAKEYCTGLGKQVQWKLWLKWLTSSNYMTDWWKELVYMRHRESLIKSTVCGVENVLFIPTTIQAARAANVVMCSNLWAKEIYQKQSVKPITMGAIPLCQQQYMGIHRTVRVPGTITDTTVRLPETAKHVAVYCKGCWYQLPLYVGQRLVQPAELEAGFQRILDRKPDPQPGECHLSALTAGSRVHWAEVRQKYFSSGVNRHSLNTIEQAQDVVYLDTEERHWQLSDPPEALSQLEREYGRTLHADGYGAWFDKPTTLMFSGNGRYTSQGEHSVADAMIYGHLREHTKYHENYTFGYTADGHAKGEVETTIVPERLPWNISEDLQQKIAESYTEAKTLVDNYDIGMFMWSDFGKDLPKNAKMSPDAFCQAAIQLAYYRDQGKFDLTYEPTMTRLFREGRTETVRSCSERSCDWVLSMQDPKATREERLEKLRLSCDNHQQLYKDAMIGKGCDRHLFAHRVLTRHLGTAILSHDVRNNRPSLGVQSPFLDAVFNMPYVLSTSQVPQHQQSELMKTLNKRDDLFFPTGMFSCPDGCNYGVCYSMRANGDMLSFLISTWKSNPTTDAQRMKATLQQVLREMKQLVLDE